MLRLFKVFKNPTSIFNDSVFISYFKEQLFDKIDLTIAVDLHNKTKHILVGDFSKCVLNTDLYDELKKVYNFKDIDEISSFFSCAVSLINSFLKDHYYFNSPFLLDFKDVLEMFDKCFFDANYPRIVIKIKEAS